MPPEAATIGAPPSGAGSSINIVEAPPPKPPPAPTTAIHVDATGNIDKGPPQPAPKRGSAMDRLRQDLQKKAQTDEPTPKPAAEKTAHKPEGSGGENQPNLEPAEKGSEAKPSPAEAATAAEKGKKVSPWKLVEEHKTARASLEKELAELKKTLPNPEEQKKAQAEIEQIRKRNAELEEEIRYTNFSKSREYADKYQKPYEDAWKKAMDDLSELTVADADGSERPLSPQDMLALVNMPLKDARAKAVEAFGDFADDVMAHRKEIRSLFEAQRNALEDARKSGASRDEERRKAIEEFRAKSQQEIQQMWTEANNDAVSNEKYAKYFKPVEGDTEGNKRLENGYALAEKAFNSPDPRDPRLTPDQRKEIVRIHAAVRHRAAAFGRALYQLQQAEAKIESLTKELNQFRGTQPGRGEGATTESSSSSHPASARESVFAALRKRAQ